MVKKILLIILIIVLLALIYPGCAVWRELGQKPRGDRLERIRQSPHFDVSKGEFVNLTPIEGTMNDSEDGSGLVDFLFGKHPDVFPTAPLPVVKTDLRSLDRNVDVVVWLGHSTLFIQLDGVRYLFDPILTNAFPVSVAMKPFRGTDVFRPDDIPDVDYLVITHDHWDHLDYKTVIALKDRVGHVVCGLGIGQHFEYWGYEAEKIHELDWFEDWTVNSTTSIHCLPSQHFSGRMGGNTTLWASYLIDGKKKIFVMGDGGYDDRFTKFAEKYPNIDLAIMENGQYNEGWKAIHLLPQQLSDAIDELHPTHVLTYHHAKFKLCVQTWYEPLENIYNNSRGKPYHLLTPQIGQIIDIHAPIADEPWWRDEI